MPDQESEVSNRSVIIGGLAGNIMEWYDFAVYGYFASVIAPIFFPTGNKALSIIATFGAFAAGFLVRPLGGMVFGHIGDKLGRKKALMLSVMLMAVPTFLIGILPGYDTLGYLAPALLVLLRMIQGLSVGGEYTTSIVFLVENAEHGRRGYMGSWSGVGSVGGALLGSAVGALLTSLLPESAVQSWGWRLAFLLGLAVAGFATYMRREIPELPVEYDQEEEGPSPVALALTTQWRRIGQLVAVLMIYSVGYYLVFLYFTTFMIERLKQPGWKAMDVNTISMAVLMFLIPMAAHISDRLGRKKVLIFSCLGFLALSYPLITFMEKGGFMDLVVAQCIFAVFMAAFAGTNPASMVESFPAKVRVSAISFAFNVSFAIFGGTTPIVAAWLLNRTSDDYSLAYFLMAAAAVSLVGVVTLEETAHVPLEDIPAASLVEY